MAKNDDDNDKGTPEGGVEQVRPTDAAPRRGGAEKAVDEPELPEDTGAAGSILVDASEVAKADGDYYDAYVGVDEDRKRRPAREALKPQWGEGELEERERADAEHDAEALRRSVIEREVESEAAQEELEASRQRVRDEHRSGA